MDSGYYAALTGLVARTQALDTAAANLSNAQTPGYRSEREFFRSNLLGDGAADSQLGRVVNNYGLLGGDVLNLQQGAFVTTGNPFDVALEGDGFFAVQTPGGRRYTRDGSFHRTQTGQLVNKAGEAVLSNAGQPINIPPGEIFIGNSGVISAGGGNVATVGVFTFPRGTDIRPEGANHYVVPTTVQVTVPKGTVVHQGSLEGSNQDVMLGSLELIVMQRQAEMMQKALTIFHTDFNKFATEDLPRA